MLYRTNSRFVPWARGGHMKRWKALGVDWRICQAAYSAETAERGT
jgi:hypothetical protein